MIAFKVGEIKLKKRGGVVGGRGNRGVTELPHACIWAGLKVFRKPRIVLRLKILLVGGAESGFILPPTQRFYWVVVNGKYIFQVVPET